MGMFVIKVKDIEDDDDDNGNDTGSAYSNKAAIDAFDAPGNQSTQEESQCCTM